MQRNSIESYNFLQEVCCSTDHQESYSNCYRWNSWRNHFLGFSGQSFKGVEASNVCQPKRGISYLHGITNNVDKHLSQFARIPNQTWRNWIMNKCRDLNVVLLYFLLKHWNYILNHRTKVEWNWLYFHLACLNLGKIQNIINKGPAQEPLPYLIGSEKQRPYFATDIQKSEPKCLTWVIHPPCQKDLSQGNVTAQIMLRSSN